MYDSTTFSSVPTFVMLPFTTASSTSPSTSFPVYVKLPFFNSCPSYVLLSLAAVITIGFVIGFTSSSPNSVWIS